MSLLRVNPKRDFEDVVAGAANRRKLFLALNAAGLSWTSAEHRLEKTSARPTPTPSAPPASAP